MFKVNNLGLPDPTLQYLNETEAFKYMVEILKIDPPRISKRCSQEIEFFYETFRNSDRGINTKSIQICDVLALSYIKIKYPFLIDFFLKTIDLFIDIISRHQLSDSFEGKQNYLTGWIKEITGKELNEFEIIRIKELIGIVAYEYLTLNNKNYHEGKEKYFQRTSDSPTLRNVLALTSDQIESPLVKNYSIYIQHTKDKTIVNRLENQVLLEYAHYFRYIKSSTQNHHIDIATEIFSRLERKNIPLHPANSGDTIYSEAIYEFIFQLLYAIEKTNRITDNLENVFTLFQKFLKSHEIIIEAKYMLLNSFANNRRGDGEIHRRLNNAFLELQVSFKDDISKLIKYVFDDANNRYFDGQKIIYECEENFFYVLYQSWSGKSNNQGEIDKLRAVAKQGLESFPEAIKSYWDRYPYRPEWRNFDDLLNEHSFSSRDANNELYMPLSNLIEITKKANLNDDEVNKKMFFWNKVLTEELQRYNETYTLKDDSSTLKAVLIGRKFYQP